jgi:NADH-quinone oxidoreductase subunit L
MNWIVHYLWLIPGLPLLAAGLSAVAPRPQRKFASWLAIGSMIGALVLSCIAFANTLQQPGTGEAVRRVFNFDWFQFGEKWVQLGWVLDPLTAVMLVMVSFVGLLIFVYSVGYMAHDENFTRFFCFLSLFAAAMLGVVIANSLLLLFICWELVGLTSYMLIGFWYHKPSAAAAAKKAFITTRIGDLAFLLGMVWLYSKAGTLLFYDDAGGGCLQLNALTRLVGQATSLGMAVSTGIALLIFCGAVGKSGQVPLHVWLPDAMEGPTPVSALIHAATMVAAGVFLVARVYPLMSATVENVSPRVTYNRGIVSREAIVLAPSAAGESSKSNAPAVAPAKAVDSSVAAHEPSEDSSNASTALQVVTWVGVITAVFAASIAMAQTDIKRILAYSTVSQLGYMMMGLGVGGVAVGMFHLITHAFFKALLFMGAGSVIHGCHEEQDIRRMGGLRKYMPITFATYAVGMLALSGFPVLFSGFWSKDAILHAAHGWSISQVPFFLGLFGALLTAFYMTRQVWYVFFGNSRLMSGQAIAPGSNAAEQGEEKAHAGPVSEPHESPGVMTGPLVILAACAILLGVIGTPAWPWFQDFLSGAHHLPDLGRLFEADMLGLMGVSIVVVFLGLGLGWWLYAGKPIESTREADPLERLPAQTFALLQNKYFIDEIYERSFIRLNAWWAKACDWLDRVLWSGLVQLASYLVVGVSWLNKFLDEKVVNLVFDEGCKRILGGGSLASRLQNGRVQDYLRVLGIALTVLSLFLIWGCRA